VLGVNQPKVSALKGYKLEGFSVERLIHFAAALEHDVVIEIRPRAPAEGVATVMVVGAALPPRTSNAARRALAPWR
jgi:hypothetical protein